MTGRPERKDVRLKEYDYSRPGYYFVTVCAKDRACLFGERGRPMAAPTTRMGQLVVAGLGHIPVAYPYIHVERFCIMPNHIHVILCFGPVGAAIGRPPSLSQVINQLKGYVSKQAGYSVWQRGYYEHVIRSEREFLEISRYIEENPLKWDQDEYYHA